MPSNYTIAKQLVRLGNYLEICGCADGHYTYAALVIQGLRGQRIDNLWTEKRLGEVEAITEEVARAIDEICQHGAPKQLEQPIDGVPVTVLDLLDIPGLGAKTARRLWTELSIGSLTDLEEALAAGKLDTLKGIGPKLKEKMYQQIANQKPTD